MAGGGAGRLRSRAGGVRRGGGVRFDGTRRRGRLLLRRLGRRRRCPSRRRPKPKETRPRRHRGRVPSVAPRRGRPGARRVAVSTAAGHRRVRVGALDRAVRVASDRCAAPPRALRPDRTPSARRRRVRARAERVPPRQKRPRAFSRHGQGVGARDILGAVDGIGGEAEDRGARRRLPDAAGGAGGAVPGGRPTRASASSAPGARAPVRPRLCSEARVAADVRQPRGYARREHDDERQQHEHAREVG
mmetsp:Transcript_1551/g.5872  ORF Transcript_1551/g.5872 Transcript_1551/m.5872 type:complete len:246 (+) Transcript_1551:1672-2409(+)